MSFLILYALLPKIIFKKQNKTLALIVSSAYSS